MDEIPRNAKVIASVFNRYSVDAGIVDGFQSSGMNVLSVMPGASTKIDAITKLAKELDDSLTRVWGVPVGVRFETKPLRVLVPRKRPQRIDFFEMLEVAREDVEPYRGRGLFMLAGEHIKQDKAKPLIIDLSSERMAHVFVAGITGSGKTTLMRNLVVSLSALNQVDNLQIVVLDPKMVDMSCLNGLPGLRYSVIREPGQCVKALADAVEEIRRRERQGVANPKNKMVVVVDELVGLIRVAGKEVIEYVDQITMLGRGLGVHLIAGTQKPLASEIGSIAKANFPVRFVGQVMSKSDANVAADTADTGAEKLPGRGAFVVRISDTIRTLQVYASEAEQIAAYVRRHRSDSLRSESSQRYRPQATADTFLGVSTAQTGQTAVNFQAKPESVPAETATQTGQTATDKLPYRMPNRQESRVIRAFYNTLGSKNAVIRELWPNRNKATCLQYIDAALGRQEVGV